MEAVADTGTHTVRRPLSLPRVLAYCAANIGYCMFFAFNNGTLTLWLQRYTNLQWLISLLGGSHSFEGIILQPLVGSVSDRLRTKWGRRRPLILLFTPISCLFLFLTPLAAHLSPSIRLGAIVTCIVLFTMTFNLAYDPYQALLADATTPDQRGKVTGTWYVFNAVGQVVILMSSLPIPVKFALVGLSMLVLSLVAVVFTPEASTTGLEHPAPIGNTIGKALAGLRTLKQARFYLLMNLMYGAGTDAVIPNITRFVKAITHCGDTDAQRAMTFILLAMGLMVIPCGLIADKIGTKRMLIVGQLLIGVAVLLGLTVSTLHQVWLVMVIAGVGTAAQNASSYPLLTRLVSDREIGFYTGLQSAAASIAGPVTLVVTGLLTAHSGYRIVFAVCGICTLLSMLFLLPIDLEKAKIEIEKAEATA